MATCNRTDQIARIVKKTKAARDTLSIIDKSNHDI